jgi:hypothetical protein
MRIRMVAMADRCRTDPVSVCRQAGTQLSRERYHTRTPEAHNPLSLTQRTESPLDRLPQFLHIGGIRDMVGQSNG